jgi:hypothetical protein
MACFAHSSITTSYWLRVMAFDPGMCARMRRRSMSRGTMRSTAPISAPVACMNALIARLLLRIHDPLEDLERLETDPRRILLRHRDQLERVVVKHADCAQVAHEARERVEILPRCARCHLESGETTVIFAGVSSEVSICSPVRRSICQRYISAVPASPSMAHTKASQASK